MKKQIVLIVTFLGLLMTFSCEKIDEKKTEDQIYLDIMSIEMQVYYGDYKAFMPNEQITNIDFFTVMEKLRKANNTKKRDEAILNLNSFNKKSNDEDLSYEEDAILKSFIRSISNRSYEDILLISDLYISDIESLNIPSCSKKRITEIIAFYKDLKVWLNKCTEDYESNTKTEEGREKWDCRVRTCVDCCIYRTLEDIEDNPVAIMYFMINIGVNTAVLGLSCAWDCI
ncbi:MAG: hypothetical protein JRJ57_05700 [Deltaproteobacteria bacterium]|nr:hypothetical protein [Deltaproteobacteria bacterium]